MTLENSHVQEGNASSTGGFFHYCHASVRGIVTSLGVDMIVFCFAKIYCSILLVIISMKQVCVYIYHIMCDTHVFVSWNFLMYGSYADK